MGLYNVTSGLVRSLSLSALAWSRDVLDFRLAFAGSRVDGPAASRCPMDGRAGTSSVRLVVLTIVMESFNSAQASGIGTAT